jgi:hypothetical protein
MVKELVFFDCLSVWMMVLASFVMSELFPWQRYIPEQWNLCVELVFSSSSLSWNFLYPVEITAKPLLVSIQWHRGSSSMTWPAGCELQQEVPWIGTVCLHTSHYTPLMYVHKLSSCLTIPLICILVVITAWIAFGNDRLFGLADMGQRELERNRTQVRKEDCVSIIIPIIHGLPSMALERCLHGYCVLWKWECKHMIPDLHITKPWQVLCCNVVIWTRPLCL